MHTRTYLIYSFIAAVLFLSSASCLIANRIHAQENLSGIAVSVELNDPDVKDGSIVSFSQNGYVLSSRAYDPSAMGVIVFLPGVAVEDITTPKSFSSASRGTVSVRVSTANGSIKKGDLLTTSNSKGIAQKATQDGYVIGTALQDYSEPDTNKEGIILVNLNFGFSSQATGLRSNLLENLNLALSSPFLSPAASLRYGLAGVIVLLSVIIGIWFFGRVAARGVEALGRNPLASRQIMIGISFNLILSLATLAIGIAVGYLILIL